MTYFSLFAVQSTAVWNISSLPGLRTEASAAGGAGGSLTTEEEEEEGEGGRLFVAVWPV